MLGIHKDGKRSRGPGFPVVEPSYACSREPEREINLRAATLFVLYGDEEHAPPGAEAFMAWCELVRIERVWRPEVG